jgi:hypothetical protein
MRFFPSIPAAVIAGALWMPLFIYATHLLERRFPSMLLQAVWGFIGFVVPLLVSTADVREMARGWRRYGVFSSLQHAREQYVEAFRRFLLPAWLRMGVWFASAILSLLLLRVVGVYP